MRFTVRAKNTRFSQFLSVVALAIFAKFCDHVSGFSLWDGFHSHRRSRPSNLGQTQNRLPQTLKVLKDPKVDAGPTLQEPEAPSSSQTRKQKVVLVAGFESFNRDQYQQAAEALSDEIELQVFADSDIRLDLSVQQQQQQHQNENDSRDSNDLVDATINPVFRDAVLEADAFVGSLVFDYDDVQAIQRLLPSVQGPRLLFECATEIMVSVKKYGLVSILL